MEPYAVAGSKSDSDLCLDFTGTIDWRGSEHPAESLSSYDSLVAWSLRKGILTDEEAENLRELAKKKKTVAHDLLEEAYQLRESIFAIFSAAAGKRSADPRDIEVLNFYLTRGSTGRKVQMTSSGFRWALHPDKSVDMMLFPIARSAAELLTSDDLPRVKECANQEDGCAALFLDCSKTQTRKWCSMDSCGNRAKFSTYYARHGHSS
jgi:predicted RNA-binding Zn ribbon-like protein